MTMLALALVALLASAPTAPTRTILAVQTMDAIKATTAFVLAFDHDGIDTDSYEILVNTALRTTVPVSALLNGTVKVPFLTGLPKGSYVFQVVAVGLGGTAASATLPLLVTPGNPTAPGQIRIIK